MRIHSTIVGSVLLVLGLTGARSTPHDGAVMSPTCTLVTRTEAAAALGAPVPAGTEKTVPMQGNGIKVDYCFYGTEVVIAQFALGSGAQGVFGQYRQSLATQSNYADVKGLGDEAFVAKGQLAVRKGQTGLIIDVGQARGGGAKELKAEKGLAVLALGRM